MLRLPLLPQSCLRLASAIQAVPLLAPARSASSSSSSSAWRALAAARPRPSPAAAAARPTPGSSSRSSLALLLPRRPSSTTASRVGSQRWSASSPPPAPPTPQQPPPAPIPSTSPAPVSKPGPASDLKIAFEENPYTLPNALTLSRMLACPVLAYAIVHDQSFLAGGLLVYAGVTDFVDGWMARHWNMGSVLGSMLDPLADKTLMATLVVALAYKSLLPMPLAVLIIGRDVALALGAFYLRFRTLPPPRTFARYWDISRPSISIHPTTFSKLNTALQIVLMGLLTVSPLLPDASAPWLEGAMWVVGGTTAGSGLSYLWVKGAIKRIPMKGR